MRKVIAAVLNDLLRASLVIAIAFSHIAVENQETVRIAQIALLKSVIINQELISEYSMPTDTTPPKNIVIVGGGSAGWMTASLLLNSLGEIGSKITLIESSRISAIGVGEGTTPLFKRFLDHMNISEEEFMSSCKATYKLGINFPGWTNSEEFNTYFHPFAAPGYSQYEQQFFTNCNLRRKGETADTNPGDFLFNAEMAEQRKAPVGPPPCDSSKMDYAYHFDTMLLADFLKKRCLEQGMNYIVDDVTSVHQKDNGDISHLVTADSGKISADFFVDCTGFRSKLLGKILAWLDGMSDELVSYEGRMASMTRCAVDSSGVREIVANLDRAGLDVSSPQVLRLEASGKCSRSPRGCRAR